MVCGDGESEGRAGEAPDGGAAHRDQVLLRRAAALAQEPPDPHALREQTEIVVFLLAHERYGIESIHVREVFHARECTPVPCTPSFVLGVINVRGRITPVLDFRKFFGLPERESGDGCKVLILGSDTIEFGVLADEISGMTRLNLSDLQSTLPTFHGGRIEYVKGVTADRLIVLDAARMMADPNLIVHEEVIV
jgi:purine-binding chemotaxis protein CheW